MVLKTQCYLYINTNSSPHFVFSQTKEKNYNGNPQSTFSNIHSIRFIVPKLLRAHLRKQQHILYRRLVGEQHTQAVNAKADAGCGWHAVLQRAQEIVIN